MATIKFYVDGKQMDNAINRTYSQDCNKYSFDVTGENELRIQWNSCGYGS